MGANSTYLLIQREFEQPVCLSARPLLAAPHHTSAVQCRQRLSQDVTRGAARKLGAQLGPRVTNQLGHDVDVVHVQEHALRLAQVTAQQSQHRAG